MNNTIKQHLQTVQEDIRHYSPHPDRVCLVAVSKKQSIEKMQAAVAAGIRDFGENRINEALQKFDTQAFPGITRHFIGYLQSNKANKCLQNFDWLHSLQTEKLARIIARSEHNINCLIEVNISGEANKSGIEPKDVSAFVKNIREYSGLEVRGLMGMAAYTDDTDQIRTSFALLRSISEACAELEIEHIRFHELSMGMTNDYRIALKEGATMLRIGTGIFGARST